MTVAENKLLTELKDFFNSKFGEGWLPKFKTYTSKLVQDGHLDQSVIDDFLDSDTRADDIVKRFNAFRTLPTTRVTPTTRRVNTTLPSDGCGHSSRQTDGCGYSSRPSRSTDGCGGSSRRSGC